MGGRDVQGELRARERGLNLTLLGLQPHPALESHPPLVALGPIAPAPGFPTLSYLVIGGGKARCSQVQMEEERGSAAK